MNRESIGSRFTVHYPRFIMSLTSWIAFRYLFSRKSGRYAPLLTVTAISSVAVGVCALIIVMSVMLGFRKELTDRLLGFNSHITLAKTHDAKSLTKEEIEKIFSLANVRDVTPFVQGEVIAEAKNTSDLLAQGARVRGIDPKQMGLMDKVEYYFPEDSEGFLRLSPQPNKKQSPAAIVGNEVVSQISVHPDFGDKIELIAPLASISPTGDLIPNGRTFDVVGVFKTGVFEYDSKYILVSFDDATKLLGEQAQEGWQIRLTDAQKAPDAMKKIKNQLSEGWNAEDWTGQNKKLFAALKLERIVMGSILVMLILIASFAIIGVVLLVTTAKRKDIAILKSIGMPCKTIRQIFIWHATFIGTLGSITGLILGLGICSALEFYQIRLPTSYYLDTLPTEVNLFSAFAFASVGIIVAVLSSLWPVKQSTELNPVEVLRYE